MASYFSMATETRHCLNGYAKRNCNNNMLMFAANARKRSIPLSWAGRLWIVDFRPKHQCFTFCTFLCEFLLISQHFHEFDIFFFVDAWRWCLVFGRLVFQPKNQYEFQVVWNVDRPSHRLIATQSLWTCFVVSNPTEQTLYIVVELANHMNHLEFKKFTHNRTCIYSSD